MKKRFTLIVTALTLLALLLPACAAPAPAPKVVEKEVVVTATPAAPPTPTPLPPGVTKITFWHAMGGVRTPFIARMVDDFNLTHPGIVVSVEFKGSYRDTLNATIAAARAGNPPHVVQVFEIGTLENIDSGIFVPVEDLTKPGEVLWEDFLDPVLNYYRIGGKLYSMPWNSSNPVLYYNKTIFKKAGLDPEKPPQTFEEVLEYGRKIKESGAAEAAITWPLHSWFFEQWMADMGQDLVDQDNGRSGRATKINLDSDAAKRIFEWWKQLYDEGLWVNPGLEAWGPARQNFISGTTAMLISSTSDVTQMEIAATEQGFELGTGFIPIPADLKRHGVVIGGASLWITKDHPQEELEAAKEFVLWMAEPAQQIRWHQGTGYFPIRKSAVDVLELTGWFDTHPTYRAAFDQLMATEPIPATQGALIGRFREVRSIIEEAVEKVITGAASVDDALAEAKAKCEKEIAEYERVVGQ